MNKVYLILFVGICLISMVSATTFLGTFTQDRCISLYQICSNCSFVNITSITFPNSTILKLDDAMTKVGVDYNYSFCNTSTRGDYLYNVCGDKDGIFVCEEIEFQITQTGTLLTTGKSIIYVILLIFMISVLGVFVYASVKIPWRHTRDIEGFIVGINNKKIWKIGAVALSYLVLMWIFAILRMISNDSLLPSGMQTFFNYFYSIMLFMMFPVIIVSIVLGFVVWMANMRLEKQMIRGFEPK